MTTAVVLDKSDHNSYQPPQFHENIYTKAQRQPRQNSSSEMIAQQLAIGCGSSDSSVLCLMKRHYLQLEQRIENENYRHGEVSVRLRIPGASDQYFDLSNC